MMKPFSKIIRQPNNHTCLPCSLAMILGVTYDDMIWLLGHNGEKVLHPEKEYPKNYQSFLDEEINCLLAGLGYAGMEVFAKLAQRDHLGELVQVEMNENVWSPKKFFRFIHGREGFLTVESNTLKGMNHAVAWDGWHVYDPQLDERKTREGYVCISFSWIFKVQRSDLFPFHENLIEKKLAIKKRMEVHHEKVG